MTLPIFSLPSLGHNVDDVRIVERVSGLFFRSGKVLTREVRYLKVGTGKAQAEVLAVHPHMIGLTEKAQPILGSRSFRSFHCVVTGTIHGDKQHPEPGRRDHSMDFLEGFMVVRHMLQYVAGDEDVDTLVAKRQLGDVRLNVSLSHEVHSPVIGLV